MTDRGEGGRKAILPKIIQIQGMRIQMIMMMGIQKGRRESKSKIMLKKAYLNYPIRGYPFST